MRDCYRQGARYYNFGAGPGAVGQFKHQFNPVEKLHPAATVLVVNQRRFRLWTTFGCPLAKGLRFAATAFSARLRRNTG
jgi:hypothetical protein